MEVFFLVVSYPKMSLFFRFLNMSLTESSGVRKADGRSVISRVAVNNVGQSLAFDFIRDKWSRVIE